MKTAEVLKRLGHEGRLKLIKEVAAGNGQRTVNELCKLSKNGQAATSQHLRRLTEAGLLSAERQGTEVYYQLNNKAVNELIDTLARLQGGK